MGDETWLPKLGPLNSKRWPRFVRLAILGFVLIRVKLREFLKSYEDMNNMKGLLKQQGAFVPEGTQEGDSVEQMMAIRSVAEKKVNRLKRIRRIYADVRGVGGDALRLLLPISKRGDNLKAHLSHVSARRRSLLRRVACSYADAFDSYENSLPAEETRVKEDAPPAAQ